MRVQVPSPQPIQALRGLLRVCGKLINEYWIFYKSRCFVVVKQHEEATNACEPTNVAQFQVGDTPFA